MSLTTDILVAVALLLEQHQASAAVYVSAVDVLAVPAEIVPSSCCWS